MDRNNPDSLFSLLRAADHMARRSPQEAAGVIESIFGPAMRKAAAQEFIANTLAEARAAHRADRNRAAYGDNVPAVHLPAVALEELLMPEGVALMPGEGYALSPALLDVLGVQPAVPVAVPLVVDGEQP